MEKHTATNFKKAVVLLNFGGPQNLEDVPDFLYEILRDPNTIHIPFPLFFQNLLARRISKKRSHIIRDQYQKIGGKSPIVEATKKQCSQLEMALSQNNLLIKVYAMHRYIVGDAETVAKQIINDQIEEVLLIPMYPHYSWSTTGSSILQCLNVFKQVDYQGKIHAIRSYPAHPLYLNALSDLLQKSLSQYKLDPQNTLILCSAHGLPQSYIKKGDPYLMELQETMEELRGRFITWRLKLCFQSKVGPAKWLQPYTDELIKTLHQQGIHSILFLPISFVNDHLETLYEINHTYFELARASGLTPYSVPALETQPQFIELLFKKTILWNQNAQGLDPMELVPPNQDFRRYDQWILFIWGLLFIITLFYALP